MKLLQSQKAFTLIEILLVASIISLLSTVVVSQSDESRKKADDAHMKQESHQIANAVNLYKNDNKGKVPVGNIQRNAEYPIVYENNTDGTAAAYQESMQILVDGGYLPEIPTSPNGQSYSYYVTEDEDNAMFAAELNFEPSNSSGSNSCDFVDTEIEWGNCRTEFVFGSGVQLMSLEDYESQYGQDPSLLPICPSNFITPEPTNYPCINKSFFGADQVAIFNSPADCSSLVSDPESEVCFGPITSQNVTDYCVNPDLSNSCASERANDNLPDSICDGMYSEIFNLSGGGGPVACMYFGTTRHSVCSFSGGSSICDGSSDSDYCSCI